MTRNIIHKSWVAHCKSSYPREFAHPKRLSSAIRTDDVLVGTVERWSEKGMPCYVSIYAFGAWRGRPDNAIIDRIYIDLDHETDPQIAIDDAITLIEGLKRYSIETTAYFSGKKGIAVYIDFPPAQIQPENKKATISAFQHAIIKRFDLHLDKDGGTVDSHVIGDINRVSRLPNTKHQTSGLYCIPVTPSELGEGIEHIRDLATQPRTDLPVTIHNNPTMPNYLRRLEQQVVGDRKKRTITDTFSALKRASQPWRYGSKNKDENIICSLTKKVEAGTATRNDMLGLAITLHNKGRTESEICDVFSLAPGYDPQKTMIQVRAALAWKHSGGSR